MIKKMAANQTQTGGYDSEFIEELPERFMCNICTKPLCDPYLVVCCGQHYCHSCLTSWLKEAPSCPHCRAEGTEFQHVINKSLKREILGQKVKCQHHKEGCEWTGELGSEKDHLESATGCGYVEVECTNRCTKIVKSGAPQRTERITIKRKNLAQHLKQSCSRREYKCSYCDKKGSYEEITGSGFNYQLVHFHHKTCPEKPIPCPNKCGEISIKRKDIEQHRLQCPLESIECPNKCKKLIGGMLESNKMLRKDLHNHLETECYLRSYKCEYCQLTSTYEAITGRGVSVLSSFLKHYDFCQEFPLSCPNNCGQSRIKRKNMDTHRKCCPEETVECPHKCLQVVVTMKRKNLQKHVREECPLRPHTCEHCGKKDTYKVITEHYATCPNYPLECSNECGALRIMRKNITHHYNKCPLQLVDCLFAEAGCKVRVIRQELEKHNSTMQQHHLGLMMGAYKQLKQEHKTELQRTRDQMKKDKAELTQTKQELKQVRVELKEAKTGWTQTKTELNEVKQSLSQYVKKKPARPRPTTTRGRSRSQGWPRHDQPVTESADPWRYDDAYGYGHHSEYSQDDYMDLY